MRSRLEVDSLDYRVNHVTYMIWLKEVLVKLLYLTKRLAGGSFISGEQLRHLGSNGLYQSRDPGPGLQSDMELHLEDVQEMPVQLLKPNGGNDIHDGHGDLVSACRSSCRTTAGSSSWSQVDPHVAQEMLKVGEVGLRRFLSDVEQVQE